MRTGKTVCYWRCFDWFCKNKCFVLLANETFCCSVIPCFIAGPKVVHKKSFAAHHRKTLVNVTYTVVPPNNFVRDNSVDYTRFQLSLTVDIPDSYSTIFTTKYHILFANINYSSSIFMEGRTKICTM